MSRLLVLLFRNSRFSIRLEKGKISFSISGFLLVLIFWMLLAFAAAFFLIESTSTALLISASHALPEVMTIPILGEPHYLTDIQAFWGQGLAI